MMRVMIVDDDPLARRGVRARLRKLANVAIAGECATADRALTLIPVLRPDLLFLDVQMPGLSGLDLLSQLPAAEQPLVVFVTAHEDYALEAFSAHAIGYLLKPIDDARFHSMMTYARQRLFERNSASLLRSAGQPRPQSPAYLTRFAIKIGERRLFVPVAEVAWIQAHGDYAMLHSGMKTYLLRETLDNLVEQLDPEAFMRVHRSAIIACKHVREIRALPSGDFLIRLQTGAEVRASRRFRDAIRRVSDRTD